MSNLWLCLFCVSSVVFLVRADQPTAVATAACPGERVQLKCSTRTGSSLRWEWEEAVPGTGGNESSIFRLDLLQFYCDKSDSDRVMETRNHTAVLTCGADDSISLTLRVPVTAEQHGRAGGTVYNCSSAGADADQTISSIAVELPDNPPPPSGLFVTSDGSATWNPSNAVYLYDDPGAVTYHATFQNSSGSVLDETNTTDTKWSVDFQRIFPSQDEDDEQQMEQTYKLFVTAMICDGYLKSDEASYSYRRSGKMITDDPMTTPTATPTVDGTATTDSAIRTGTDMISMAMVLVLTLYFVLG